MPTPDAHRALYRRWRAQRFGELIGQDPIVATLRRAVAGDRLAHSTSLRSTPPATGWSRTPAIS
jgi:DNA polymerase-3 subunit gamma/tau